MRRFTLPQNGISDPISTPTATAIIRVIERQDVTDAQIAEGRDQLRDEMIGQRRDRFFSAYMQRRRTNLTINISQDTLTRVTGGPRRPRAAAFRGTSRSAVLTSRS